MRKVFLGNWEVSFSFHISEGSYHFVKTFQVEILQLCAGFRLAHGREGLFVGRILPGDGPSHILGQSLQKRKIPFVLDIQYYLGHDSNV